MKLVYCIYYSALLSKKLKLQSTIIILAFNLLKRASQFILLNFGKFNLSASDPLAQLNNK